MQHFESLTLRTNCGIFIHLSEVDSISSSPYSDEDGVINVLASDPPPTPSLWIKVDDNIYTVHLMDAYNTESMGIDTGGYQTYTSMSNEQRVERRLVELWANLRYPDYEHYFDKHYR